MTNRQQDILRGIVETYAQTAQAVPSNQLADSFSYSPATIRSEMAELERAGYIIQPHTSAGRIPTDKGYRYYVNNLSDSPAEGRVARALARRVQTAGEIDASIKVAAESLAQVTRNVGMATLSDSLYFTGLARLFGHPEFFGGRQAFEAARLLDSLGEWLEEASPAGQLNVYIGHENPIGKASGCSLIIARFSSPYSDNSYVGVLGPTRQNYRQTISLVSYAGNLLKEALQ
jgi:heat-inducible transcriptional repressor